MKILLTGAIQSFADKKGTVVLESIRKAKEGPVTETFYLKFHSDEAYQAFKGLYRLGSGVQVIGLVRQIQTPLVDRGTKKALTGHNGKDLRNTLLAVEVKEHKAVTRDEFDTLYAHGVVSIIEKQDLRQTGSGRNWIKLRVAYYHYKRHDEERGQADFYNLVAFGHTATSLDNMEKGRRFLVDYAVPALNPYEMKDVAHSDGTPVTRNSPEMTLWDFSFLPRDQQEQHEAPVAHASEEIPF